MNRDNEWCNARMQSDLTSGENKIKKIRVEEKILSTKLFYLFCKQYNTVISN
jgi:hypothetical protein